MKKCQFCAEDIKDAAIVCKHCGRDQKRGSMPAEVKVAQVDPFAAYRTPIQGKSAGRITVVGYAGIALGGLIILVAGVSLSSAQDGGEGAFLLALIGAGVSIASFLWARR